MRAIMRAHIQETMQRIPLLIGLVVFLSGCTTTGPIEKISTDKKVALISAIDPVMNGHRPGITILGNKNWTEETPDFDVNALVLDAVKKNLNRDIRLVDGRGVEIPLKKKKNAGLATDSSTDELKKVLTALSREWRVDLIVLVQTTSSRDWLIGTKLIVEGFGHYSRGRNAAYCVFGVRIFDCKTGQFTGSDRVKQAQTLPGISWHDSWKEYSPEEQRVVMRGLKAVITEITPALLSKTGLTDIEVAAPSPGSWFLNPAGPRPQSYLPEGNELEIPEGVSKQAARMAVVSGLNDRGWILQTNTGDLMVGVHRDGKKEAICTFTFTDHSIVLAPEGHEIQKDGRRVSVGHYQRWHKNLKESIVEALMKAPIDTRP